MDRPPQEAPEWYRRLWDDPSFDLLSDPEYQAYSKDRQAYQEALDARRATGEEIPMSADTYFTMLEVHARWSTEHPEAEPSDKLWRQAREISGLPWRRET